MNELTEEISDRRAEVEAALWLENGGTPDRLLFEPLGLFGRSYRQDIEKNEFREIGQGKWKVFSVNRMGIYDALPEGLVHLPTRQTPDKKRKIEEIRLQRRKEQQARRFFLPLEQEYYLIRLWMEFIEQRAGETRSVNTFTAVMSNFWQLPEGLNEDRVLRLLDLLPVVLGSDEDTRTPADLMHSILGDAVHIERTSAPDLAVESSGSLGQGMLGVDILFGGEVSTYQSALRLSVGLKDLDRLADYLPGRPGHQLLNWLIEWFLPAEAEVTVQFGLPATGFFTLNGESTAASRLGYSTCL
ncbi:type VI secretion system baseplate subunit TssG [Larkinella soli]|uniref:type VI secretion system baseplate subunit TssG n=1 Tax=Larkinella soli TaxID=1770527 RepID=UPI0013E3C637|nr:type VI secretion system baseplate subunit TssG [Larkinella soli]